MNILTPLTSGKELAVSALVAVGCHVAFFSFFPGGNATAPELSLAAPRTSFEVALTAPSRPLREVLPRPERERKTAPARDSARLPRREVRAAAPRSRALPPARPARRLIEKSRPVREVVSRRTKKEKAVRVRKALPEEIRPSPGPKGGGSDAFASREASYTLKSSRLAYPRFALEMGIEGRVVLDVRVLPDGRVGEVRILTSSTHDILDRDALRQARENLVFQPAVEKGRPAASWKKIAFNYSLNDPSPGVEGEGGAE